MKVEIEGLLGEVVRLLNESDGESKESAQALSKVLHDLNDIIANSHERYGVGPGIVHVALCIYGAALLTFLPPTLATILRCMGSDIGKQMKLKEKQPMQN